MTQADTELDEMRSQMHELKNIINRQERVNERLMRKVMAGNSAWIRKFNSFQIFILLPFIYLSFLPLIHFQHLSWTFYWATTAMCTISVVYDVYLNRLKNNDYFSKPLLELAEILEKRRRLRRRQMCVGLPTATLWLAWYAAESDNFAWIGAIIGGIIGGCIGVAITTRAQRTDADAIKDIHEMMNQRGEE